MRQQLLILFLAILALPSYSYAKKVEPSAERTYRVVECEPTFRRKEFKEFHRWMWNKLYYPYNRAMTERGGEVFVQFVIETDGSLSTIEILESPSRRLSKRVVKALEAAPRFTPATIAGRPVRYETSLVVTFRVNKKTRMRSYNAYRDYSNGVYGDRFITRYNNAHYYRRDAPSNSVYNRRNYNMNNQVNIFNSVNKALYDFEVRYPVTTVTKSVVVKGLSSHRSSNFSRHPEGIYSINRMPTLVGGRPYVEYIDWIFEGVKMGRYLESTRKKREQPLIISTIHDADGAKPIFNILSTPSRRLARRVVKRAEESPVLSPARQGDYDVRYRGFIATTPQRLSIFDSLSFSQGVRLAIADDSPMQLRYVDKLPTYYNRSLKYFEDDLTRQARWSVPQHAANIGGDVRLKIVLGRDGVARDIGVVSSPDDRLSVVAVKCVESMPNLWTPAEVYGQKVSVEIYFTISFDYR